MSYKTELPCFSFTCSAQSEEIRKHCRYSNKILLPPTILNELSENEAFEDANQILFFKVINKALEFGHVCGVHEFTASPGICHVPYHIMEDLGIQEGQNIEIEKVAPPQGTYIKLRPHKTAFIELSDPKAILEKILSEDYPVVTRGQTIAVNYKELGKVFRIDIVETKPAEVISIINTDINVDFDEPLDYVSPPPSPPQPTAPHPSPAINPASPPISPPSIENKKINYSKLQKTGVFIPFSGTGHRLGSK